MADFFQDPPKLENTFTSDLLLQNYLRKKLPADVLKSIQPHLQKVGGLAATTWLEWSREAETNPPKHIAFDPWGRRIDEIVMSSGWKNLEKAAATEGIVAAAYERKYAEWSRVYQMSLLYLYHSSSAFVSCPLAMTDGAARVFEIYGNSSQKSSAYKHLTTRDPAQFWTSGQWMTEATGGSDVSGTETIAKRNGVGWTLNGKKWFTSSVTSQMAMLLARPEGAEQGSRGLSLFYVETKNPDGRLKNLEVLRLKDKLGTRALPTAELRLHDIPGELVGDIGGGVKKISTLFNITRVYNSICAVSAMRRALDWAHSYSKIRKAFGKNLIEHPLHQTLLSSLEKTFEDCFKLTFFVVELLGKEETNTATENEKILLRALTPIVKLYTGKKVMEVTSEVTEIFGGVGYVEDSGIPTLLRDAQVFSIWEGTTNVLSLDFLRAVEKEQAWPALAEYLKTTKTAIPPRVLEILSWAQKGERAKVEAHARELTFSIAETLAQTLS